MKLKNKKTGKIHEITVVMSLSKLEKRIVLYSETDKCSYKYNSLAELNEEWEDAPEEPNIYYFIDIHGEVKQMEYLSFDWQNKMKQLGNYFETKEEAEKAVEKLKAWKRLKDKGFRITLHGCKGNAWLEANWGNLQGDYSDVLLLFGGEE